MASGSERRRQILAFSCSLIGGGKKNDFKKTDDTDCDALENQKRPAALLRGPNGFSVFSLLDSFPVPVCAGLYHPMHPLTIQPRT